MTELVIYSKSNIEKIRTKNFEYNGTFLGEKFLSVSINSPVPVDFSIGDWCEYRGERFELNVEPTTLKQASRNSIGNAFVYDSIKFNSLSDELVRCQFLDIVKEDNLLHYTSLPTFSFFASSVKDLADRLQANLDRAYGKGVWSIHVASTGTIFDKPISISDTNCWNALALANSEFGLNFTVKGRVVTIGSTGRSVGRTFEYGKGNGLITIEKTSNDNQAVITRLRAYGNTKNLPDHYYKRIKPDMPNNMAVNRLMLPGFPNTTYDPYIDSPAIAEFGVREGVIYFDGSNAELEDIYPTIEGLKDKSGNPLNVLVSAEQIQDDGIYPKEGEKETNVPNFHITIPDIGFDINDYLSTQGSATISFKTGMCAGREFVIVECKKNEDGNYVLECQRQHDSDLNLYFPYNRYNLQPLDKFVLLNINMPDIFIEQASQRLLEAAREYLSKNDKVRYTYTPKVDSIYVRREYDSCADKTKSIFWSLCEGDIFDFSDEDLEIDEHIFIDHLSINENGSDVPAIEVTLTDEKESTTLERIQNQIDKIKNNGLAGNGQNNINMKMLRDEFLSKKTEDTAQGTINFNRGLRTLGDIRSEQFVSGMVGGAGWRITPDGYGEMNGLTLREFLEVPELRFNRIDVVSGELWNSIAFGTIEKVVMDSGSTGTAWLHLEASERAGLKVGDICRGIFADFGDGAPKNNEIDECGFMKVYGFSTSYFTPTEILDNQEGLFSFRFSMRSGCKTAPCAYMKFAVYGSFNNSSRRASAYATRTYKRYLKDVSTWVIDPDRNIGSQFGDLDGLTIGGMEMQGQGAFLTNVYMTGSTIQFTPQQKAELQGKDAYSVTLSDYEAVVHVDINGHIVGDLQRERNVIISTDGKETNVIERVGNRERNVTDMAFNASATILAFRGATPLYHASVVQEDSYIVNGNFTNCTGMVVNGRLVLTGVIDTTKDAYVDLEINCEGNAVFIQHFALTIVVDGYTPQKGVDYFDGEDGKNGNDAQFYALDSNATSLHRNQTGTLSPSSVYIYERYTKGSTTTNTNNYYICAYGLNGTTETFLTSNKSHSSGWSFPVDSYNGYSAFRFRLKTGNNSGDEVGTPITVTVANDGKDGGKGDSGYNGCFPEYRGVYDPNATYVYQDPSSTQFPRRDYILYNIQGHYYNFIVKTVGSLTNVAPSSAQGDANWELMSQYKTILADTLIGENCNIGGFMVSEEKLISKSKDANGNPKIVLDGTNGTLALSSSIKIGTGNIDGLGSLATKNSVTTSEVSGLGGLATKSTISSAELAQALKNTIDGKATTDALNTAKSDLEGKIKAVSDALGGKISASYLTDNGYINDLVGALKKETIIVDGYIKTSMIDVENLWVRKVDVTNAAGTGLKIDGSIIYGMYAGQRSYFSMGYNGIDYDASNGSYIHRCRMNLSSFGLTYQNSWRDTVTGQTITANMEFNVADSYGTSTQAEQFLRWFVRGLPTTDPKQQGRVYRDGQILKVSNG